MTALPPNPDKIGVARHLSAQLLPILVWPNPKLHQQCEDVTKFDDELGQLIMDMFLTMDTNNGIGLAAPQVGVLKNIITLSIPKQRRIENEHSPTANPEYEEFLEHVVLINPEVESYGKQGHMIKVDEGCLSVPGYFEKRYRLNEVTINYITPQGREASRTFFGLEAFAVQHEMDHLEGKLFIDELSKLKKERVKKKVKKALKHR